jgi:O-antigen/teichoic acid export membrane protein
MKFIKDVSWNSMAYIVPMAIAMPVLGVMSRYLGIEKFGLFMLMFTIFGYAGIFDLGFSRALVRCISINRDNQVDVKEYLLSASILIGVFSILPLCIMLVFANGIVELLNVTVDSYDDAINSMIGAAIGFPLIMITVLWNAYLEGKERFKELSMINLVTSVGLSVLPLMFVFYENTLESAVLGLIVARTLSFIIIVGYVLPEIKRIKSKIFNFNKVKELFQYGGWLTLTNLISPLLTTIDRFVLSSLSGANKLALYTAPSELIKRLLIIPAIITRTAFPRLAKNNDKILKRKIRITIIFLMLLLTVPILIFSEFIITSWLGSNFNEASDTLRILVLGLFFAGLAQLPATAIQASGHSKIAAYIHLAELIPYLILLYVLVTNYSYNGAALAWTIRVSADFVIFSIVESKLEDRKSSIEDVDYDV